MIEQRLVEILLADETVSGYVGARIMPVVVRSTTALPAITYRPISSSRGMTLGGPDYWATMIVELVAWAVDYADAAEIADAVRSLMHGYDDDTDEIGIAEVTGGAVVYVEELDAIGYPIQVTLQYQES